MSSTDILDDDLPSIPLRFTSLNKLYQSYMPWLKNGGLFVPTSKRFQMGEKVLMIVVLPESKDKYRARGVVSWVNPKDSTGHKMQGVGVEFSDDAGLALRYRIDGLVRDKIKEGTPTFTL